MNGFDNLAWCYDLLAKLVFGNRLVQAQNTFLHLIAPTSRVLILGGGTGAIVKVILQRQPACEITYIDASRSMIERAKARLKNHPHVQFIHGTEDSIPMERNFDVVITPYYLDLFPEIQLRQVIDHIGKSLREGAFWIVADFCHSKKHQHRAMLAVMYHFFRWTTGIAARSLPDWSAVLSDSGWSKTDSVRNGFLESAVFRRSPSPT